jgi:predicted RND superfamily exporter protein
MAHVQQSDLPVIGDLSEFDYQSGTFLERLVFNNRGIVVLLCALTTLILGFQATKIELRPGFEKILPKAHEYVINYKANSEALKGLGNIMRIVVSTTEDSMFTPENLKFFEQVNDEIFFIPGVDRNGMKSIFTPNTRWRVVTEEGFEGGPVIPGDFDASSPESMREVQINIARAGILGDLIANNGKSLAIIVPLLDVNPETGERLDYIALSDQLEEIREKFTEDNPTKSIHIIGFAKLVSDLIDGLLVVMSFFAVAVVIATILLYWYTRCMRSTVMVIFITLIAVLWQIGLLATFGFELDPFSILVPFLVFAIGVSHGAQKLNGVLQDIGRGTHRYIAARYTFRRLFLAGVTALLSDGVHRRAGTYLYQPDPDPRRSVLHRCRQEVC